MKTISPPKKAEEDKYLKQSVSFSPELLARVLKYCQEEERSISWVVRKAVDAWLKERGY